MGIRRELGALGIRPDIDERMLAAALHGQLGIAMRPAGRVEDK